MANTDFDDIAISTDKSGVYNLNDTITLTLTYVSTGVVSGVPQSTADYEITAVFITDANGEEEIPGGNFGSGGLFSVTTPASNDQPMPVTAVSITDSGNHTWTLVSNTMLNFDSTSGRASWQAIFTTTA
jgi:hypothetical protein